MDREFDRFWNAWFIMSDAATVDERWCALYAATALPMPDGELKLCELRALGPGGGEPLTLSEFGLLLMLELFSAVGDKCCCWWCCG